ncbi:11458_t:CDS:2, partial [Scutellospora calospora]
ILNIIIVIELGPLSNTQILKNETTTNKDKLSISNTLTKLQDQLEKNKEEIYVTLLITQQEDITPTLTTLREYFTISHIPEYLLNLPPLLELT